MFKEMNLSVYFKCIQDKGRMWYTSLIYIQTCMKEKVQWHCFRFTWGKQIEFIHVEGNSNSIKTKENLNFSYDKKMITQSKYMYACVYTFSSIFSCCRKCLQGMIQHWMQKYLDNSIFYAYPTWEGQSLFHL